MNDVPPLAHKVIEQREDDESAATQNPVDFHHLHRHALGDRDLMRELLHLFNNQSGLYLERLKTASTDRAWCEAAHSLKGASRAIGAWRVAEAAQNAESLPQGAGPAARAEALQTVEICLAEARDYIASADLSR